MKTLDEELFNVVRTMKRQTESQIMKILAPLNMQYNLIIEDNQILFLSPPSDSNSEAVVEYWLDIEDIFSILYRDRLLFILTHNCLLHIFNTETLVLGFWEPTNEEVLIKLARWSGRTRMETMCLKLLNKIKKYCLLRFY